jgi:superoxide dismutase
MDFYDAMKKGTSEEDLVKAFNEALNAAKKKLEDERRTKEEQEKAKKIIDNRRALAANALTSYLTALCPETKITKEDVEKALSDSEKLFGSMGGFLAQFTSTIKDGKAKTNVNFKKILNEDDDDTALNKFFDELNWMF